MVLRVRRSGQVPWLTQATGPPLPRPDDSAGCWWRSTASLLSAATSRSAVQIAGQFGEAPLPISAVRVRSGRRRCRRHGLAGPRGCDSRRPRPWPSASSLSACSSSVPRASCCPTGFPDATVWTGSGQRLRFVPLCCPSSACGGCGTRALTRTARVEPRTGRRVPHGLLPVWSPSVQSSGPRPLSRRWVKAACAGSARRAGGPNPAAGMRSSSSRLRVISAAARFSRMRLRVGGLGDHDVADAEVPAEHNLRRGCPWFFATAVTAGPPGQSPGPVGCTPRPRSRERGTSRPGRPAGRSGEAQTDSRQGRPSSRPARCPDGPAGSWTPRWPARRPRHRSSPRPAMRSTNSPWDGTGQWMR